MKRLYFFGTRNDQLSVLAAIEGKHDVKYVRSDMLSEPSPQVWSRAEAIQGLGCADADQHIACAAFLIVKTDSKVGIRSSVMLNGRKRYDVDQLSHPHSVVFISGGEWRNGTLIHGSFTTLSDDIFAQAVMRAASAAIKKRFTHVQAFWVGPEALVALRKGTRLTGAIQSPAEYDLRESTKEVADSEY